MSNARTLAGLIDTNSKIQVPSGGIQFADATNAITAVANQSNLIEQDGYEEGTFQPRIRGSSTSGTGEYSTQEGNYIKIGNLVYFRFALVWSEHTGTGSLRIGDFPFTPIEQTYYLVQTENITLTANNTAFLARISSTNVDYLIQSPVGGGIRYLVSMDTAGDIRGSGTFITS